MKYNSQSIIDALHRQTGAALFHAMHFHAHRADIMLNTQSIPVRQTVVADDRRRVFRASFGLERHGGMFESLRGKSWTRFGRIDFVYTDYPELDKKGALHIEVRGSAKRPVAARQFLLKTHIEEPPNEWGSEPRMPAVLTETTRLALGRAMAEGIIQPKPPSWRERRKLARAQQQQLAA